MRSTAYPRGRALLLLFSLYCGMLSAQAPSRALRGTWMATVLNIDYPSQPTTDPERLRQEFRSKLQNLRLAGINTVFVQVRSAGEALYPSRYAPWSQYLTGRQGQAPEGGFDPLEYMVGEAHAQGVEFHAWVNPYRVAMSLDSFALHPQHLFNQHRDWVRVYGERMYLDPGLPAVRAHLGAVIDELVANYDIDGLHFDDYFYPYPIAGAPFPDSVTYSRYNSLRLPLADWRRRNVNEFVAETHRRVKAVKPWVHFGVSPFGVWRNRSQDGLMGSDSRASVSSYDDLYADALGWAADGTVDYLMPQLYWNIGYDLADHAKLLRWWSAYVHPPTKLYVGHAAYKVGNDRQPEWADPEEIPRQLALSAEVADGNVFFSTKSVLRNPLGLAQTLGRRFVDPVLLPERQAPGPAIYREDLLRQRRTKKSEEGLLLRWELSDKLTEDELPYYFALYRSPADGEENYGLIHRTPYGQNCYQYHFIDRSETDRRRYRYRVVAMDRYHRAIGGSED